MTDKLYLGRVWRYVESDIVRGIKGSNYENSGFKVVVASSQEEANSKFSRYLEKNTRFRNWDKTEVKVLTAEQDLPLEKRVEILKEIFEVIK